MILESFSLIWRVKILSYSPVYLASKKFELLASLASAFKILIPPLQKVSHPQMRLVSAAIGASFPIFSF
jgi:hypothetical protein